MSSRVCIDASFVVKLGLPEEGSYRAETLWRKWHRQRREIAAPPLLGYEITSALRYAAYRGRIDKEEAFRILRYLLTLLSISWLRRHCI